MTEESTLLERAREAIGSGKLPNRCPERTWGGPGSGAPCVICGEPVRPDEVEFELEFARGDADFAVADDIRANYRVHLGCFAAWERERTNPVTGATESGSDAAASQGVLPGQVHRATLDGRERDAHEG